MTIHLLSEETINKIAAGEVVERPANVVKELIENSLDARSTSIEIEIKESGRKLIRVTDNGLGMTRQELALSITRHATSKITNFEDLSSLSTMGLRGEALASIAAVSNLTIQSKTRDSETGWEITVSGGKLKESKAWSGTNGTNVEIKELFFNTPARAKFLKTPGTEKHHIIRTIEEIALSFNERAFKVISDGSTVLNCAPAKKRLERIIDILGKEFAETLLPIELEHPYLKINAFITRAENSLASKSSQFLFVNGRAVSFPRFLIHSVYDAYKENLPAGRHPGVILFFETNPSEIDVNIHPAKREVRFTKEQEIHGLVNRALKEKLSGTPFEPAELRARFETSNPEPKHSAGGYGFMPRRELPTSREIKETLSMYEPEREQLSALDDIGKNISIQPIGQVFGVYILSQSNNELYVIDQHAAAERVRFEKYLADWRKNKVPVQELLFPVTIELPPSQMGIVKENKKLLNQTGWELEEFGTNTFRVTGVPAILGTNFEAKTGLGQIIESLIEEKNLPSQEKIEKIIRAACRASVKAGDTVSNEEAKRLVADLFRCKAPFTCPHGRPTIFKISSLELKKYFGRS
jgi:DNA mismatch repair protein MutL